AIDGLIFVQDHHKTRRLNDLHRESKPRNAGFRTWRETVDAVCVVAKIVRALLVQSCGPRPDLLRLQVRGDVDQITSLLDPPDSGEVRLAIRGSRGGGREVGLAVACSGHSRGWVVWAARQERRGHRA